MIKLERKLKTCPFCGSNVDALTGALIISSYHIVCVNPDCGADVWFYGAELDDDLMAERWNRRTENENQD